MFNRNTGAIASCSGLNTIRHGSSQGGALVRIVIGDKHPLIRFSIRNLIANHQQLWLVAEAGTGAEVLTSVDQYAPDMVILDAPAICNPSGSVVLRELQSRGGKVHVLVMSATDDKGVILEALHFGCLGVVHKGSPVDVLLEAIKTVANGRRWVDPHFSPAAKEQVPAKHSATPCCRQLSPREFEIAALLARGLTNAEIATDLFISEQTVKNHLHSAFLKTGVSNRSSLALLAVSSDQ